MKFQTELKTWSTGKLRQAAKDLLEMHSTGVLPDGPVKEFRELIKSEIPDVLTSHMSIAENMIEREVMERFVAITEAFKINA